MNYVVHVRLLAAQQGMRIGMTFTKHPLWVPLRESLGSFPHSLPIAPASLYFSVAAFCLLVQTVESNISA